MAMVNAQSLLVFWRDGYSVFNKGFAPYIRIANINLSLSAC